MTEINDSSGLLEKWSKGSPITARHLNQPVDALRDITRVDPPSQIFPAGAGVSGSVVQQFQVVTVFDDWIRCIFFDHGVGQIGFILVAKPYLLRRTPFDEDVGGRFGITYVYSGPSERLATNQDADTESQLVIPRYVSEDIIYATTNIVGGTNVFQDPDAPEGEDKKELIWLDDNRDGRFWASVSES